MVKVRALYSGQKHCELSHGPSGSQIATDAPLDNAGKGELFSPTDLVAAALTSCILTTMAIVAERDGVTMVGASADVEKVMASSPRRIASLHVQVTMPAGIPADYRAKLERAAHACPVHKSLHPDIAADITFTYP